MGSIAGDDFGNGGGGKEERILVSVRIRPLNSKEIDRHDTSDWECINNDTVIFKNHFPDRAMYPTAYTLDRVFGSSSTTQQVYEEGAREVVLSVVSGINSSIFAYGQTSSGKTYTMCGVTACGVSEIYDYIHKHPERDFVLKFSAIEIYNEGVKDLLNPDSGQLRLLDDPEKGTIVEKLTEEILTDQAHLEDLLSFCQSQRQTGETTLNEMSSRSHQILRLSIESSTREFSSRDNFSTLMATVNFVDLAGSERASQALTAGSRLKEGCHINRSLLTLGTVIRKLSKGRNGHVPYRDSKLTRILQSSLGGNARTAIICTMSPAHSHIEQSRNTLQFASCAKEVVTSARVNVVMTDKVLVKHLRRELAHLENQLRHMGPASLTCQSDVLKEKEEQIKKMEKEMKDLMQQRDLAQSRLEDLLRVVGDDQASGQWEEISHALMPCAPVSYEDTSSLSGSSCISYHVPESGVTVYTHSPPCSDYTEYDHQSSGKPIGQYAVSPLYHSSSAPTIMREDEPATFLSPDLNSQYKTARGIEKIDPSLNKIEDFDLLTTDDIDSLLPMTPTVYAKNFLKEAAGAKDALKDHIDAKDALTETTGTREHYDHEPRSIGEMDLKVELPSARDLGSARRPPLVRSRSCRATLMTNASSIWYPELDEYKTTPPSDFSKDFYGRSGVSRKRSASSYGAEQEAHSRDYSENSEENGSGDDSEARNAKTTNDRSSNRIYNSAGQMEEMIHNHHQQEHDDHQDLENDANEDFEVKITIKDVCMDPVLKSSESPSRWPLEFEKKQREIVELWHECNVSLIHRSCFFILIKGDPTDSIYMEVEYRRLSFLRSASAQENLGLDLSLKNIRREREKISRLMNRMPLADRESLYTKWGVALDSKQRRLQLARRLWTDTKDMDHVRDSAMLVAKLFGFLEPGLAPKEMFGLSFTPQLASGRSFTKKLAAPASR